MAIYELHYERLQGPRRHPAAPAVAIALSDLRVLRKRRSIKLASGGIAAFTLFLSGYAVVRSGILKDYLPAIPIASMPLVDERYFYQAVTTYFFHLLLTMLALFAGAGRIAEDLRTGALSLYLAKPLSRWDYLAGKVGATAIMVGLGALGAPLTAFLAAALVDPEFLPNHLRLGAALVVLGVVSTAYYTASVLFFSSMVRSGRLAGLLFAALVFVSAGMQEVAAAALRSSSTSWLGFRVNLQTVAAYLLGMTDRDTPPLGPALLVIALVIVIGLGFAHRRVRAVEIVS